MQNTKDISPKGVLDLRIQLINIQMDKFQGSINSKKVFYKEISEPQVLRKKSLLSITNLSNYGISSLNGKYVKEKSTLNLLAGVTFSN